MGKNLEPQYSFRCDAITIKKLEYIANKNTRNRNQEMKHIIKNHIAQYEKENGPIILGDDPEPPKTPGTKATQKINTGGQFDSSKTRIRFGASG